jgi:hypothetical protein
VSDKKDRIQGPEGARIPVKNRWGAKSNIDRFRSQTFIMFLD